ncbi:eCIS core domain-containing protein [Dictyobacter formicarum]|uniref:eCIS core domain-containing protein n=1 Tax=Dictyobacter formicarum TaxID=2778368 RepID=A0ABQ3VBC6_9CHLR|nr:DUF4157 domain-containing protein [Dictyobacter formicarum]GHO83197.1 hypothetical protein KSZ_12030 [Dictyobacter formicarum]
MSSNDGYREMAGEQKNITSEAGTRAFQMLPFPTLGERLAHEARRIVSRRIPTFLWLQPLATAMERVTTLPVPAQEHFQRIEVLPNYNNHPSQWPPNQVRSQQQPQELTPHGFMEGQPLAPHLRQQLQNFVGHGTESVRIHNDEVAHDFAQAQGADAVTVGQHIFFRQDRFRPQEIKGFALLAHEALHVVRFMQPDSSWRRTTQAGIQEEEQEAATLENNALAARRNPSSVATSPPLSARPPLQAQRSGLFRQAPGFTPQHMARPATMAPSGFTTIDPMPHPMRASTDRSLEQGTMSTPTTPDVDELKRALYRDLMRQIKADLERGG